MKFKIMNVEFQCGACLNLTKIKTKKPRRYTPTFTTQRCATCLSRNELRFDKLSDGTIRCKTLEVGVTEEGRKHYYLLNPEKDPDYVQQDGTENHQSSQPETKYTFNL